VNLRWIDDPGFCRWYTVMSKLLREAPSGLVLEFGCGECRTTNELAEMANPRVVHAFDSFLGLPEAWGSHLPAGACRFPRPKVVRGNVRLHEGLFQDTLPALLASAEGQHNPISFVHVDCDLYSSSKFVLDALGHRLGGAIVAFDEFEGSQLYADSEGRALREYCDAHRMRPVRLGKQHVDGAAFRLVPME
jgi:hypothetical protein